MNLFGPMDIRKNFNEVKDRIPGTVRLVVVSKTRPLEDIMTVYDTGHRVFGENKAQELISKQPHLPADIFWHFIGHLQTNKVKYIASFVQLVESVDSIKLLAEINKQAFKNNRVIDCLLQFHIATEETKFGLSPEEADELLSSDAYKAMKNIRITGVMGMATYTEDHEKVRREFRNLKSWFISLKGKYFKDVHSFADISMGMSGDWEIAVEEGATIVRIGTAIFGERDHQAGNPWEL
jgi:pyridoxal phosphate enzyme (YggS family)